MLLFDILKRADIFMAARLISFALVTIVSMLLTDVADKCYHNQKEMVSANRIRENCREKEDCSCERQGC